MFVVSRLPGNYKDTYNGLNIDLWVRGRKPGHTQAWVEIFFFFLENMRPFCVYFGSHVQSRMQSLVEDIKVFGGHKSSLWAPDTPVLDIWWRHLWLRVRKQSRSLPHTCEQALVGLKIRTSSAALIVWDRHGGSALEFNFKSTDICQTSHD